MRNIRKVALALAAAALPGVAALGLASSAFAATPVNTTCTSSVSGTVNNLIVPAGAKCQAFGADIKGRTFVAGELQMFGGEAERNVYVTGGTLQVVNNGATFDKSVVITGSAGGPDGQDGFWDEYSNTLIKGNLYFLDNSSPLYSGDGQSASTGKTTVDGDLVWGFNTGANQTVGSLTVNGTTTSF
jgi:hypothetical protein